MSVDSSDNESSSGNKVSEDTTNGSGHGGQMVEPEVGEEEHEDQPGASLDAASSSCGYPDTGLGTINVPAREARPYDWVSSDLLASRSFFEAGLNDFSAVVKKINGKSGRVFQIDGMKPGEHIATWPGDLKFTMYHVVIRDMNVRPPFTAFQQTALARLDVAPSQLHPNAWAFLRAYELLCIHLDRPTSVPLFFHLFELNRNKQKGGNRGHEHLSLRAKTGCKCFRPFKDSLGGDWKRCYYWVEPVNDEAVNCVGRFNEDRRFIEYTKFPTGWTASHYWRKPATYTVEESSLSEADRLTKRILLYISSRVPYKNPKYRGIPTELVVKRKTRRGVQTVLDTMASSRLMEMMDLALKGAEDVDLDLGLSDNEGAAGEGNIRASPVPRNSPVNSPTRAQAIRAPPITTVHAGSSGAQPELDRAKRSAEVLATSDAQKKRKSSREADTRKDSKRSKHREKAPQVTAVPLSEDFLKQSYENWRVDPVAASARVFLELAEVHRIEKTRYERQAQAQVDAANDRKSELEQELSSVKTALNKANFDLERLRQERTDLEKTKNSCLTRAVDAEKKLEDLKKRFKDLEALELAAQDRIKSLETRVSELEGQLSSKTGGSSEPSIELQKLRAQNAKLKSAYQNARAEGKKAADNALLMYEDGFKEALKQIAIVHPGFNVNTSFVDSANMAEEDRIVRVDPVSKQKTMVFPSPEP